MKLRHRPMQPGDIRECVDIVANHPVIGPRYGPAIEHLPEAWLRLLECESHKPQLWFMLARVRAPPSASAASAPLCRTIFYAR